MDVAFGTTYVPFPRRGLKSRLICTLGSLLLLIGLMTASPAHALMKQSQPMHWSAKKQLWDRKTNLVELLGDAVLHQQGEVLTADYMLLDLTKRTIFAKGNCVYIASGTIMYGREMHFNLDDRTGVINGGRISTDSFSLTGERLIKLGEGRFETHDGEYSTCKDCPQSWSFAGQDVDLEIGGYAYMRNVVGEINDAPLAWFPYLIVPLKTKRQTGLLFPRFRLSGADGFVFVQPFFWAISRSLDMTIAAGDYGSRGERLELEGRYAETKGNGSFNYFYQKDISYAFTNQRYAIIANQDQELPWGIHEKFRYQDVSDSQYPIDFQSDIKGRGEPVLPSDLIFSREAPTISAYVAARRFRNLLGTDPVAFDSNTVQALPTAAVTTNDKQIIEPLSLIGGLTLGVTNFTRSGSTVDNDIFTAPPVDGQPRPGVDPIRKATRFSFTPKLYTTVRPWDVFAIVPSLQYRGYYYNFHNEKGYPNLARGYLLFQTDFTTQIERIFDTTNPDIPRTKHLLRPILTYSWIPYVNEPGIGEGNPFLQQIQYAQNQGFSGYNFDDNDIVPIDTSRSYNNYFVPLGNSLSYGFSSQYILRHGNVDQQSPNYQRMVDFSAGQTINFREFRASVPSPQPFSRFFASLALDFGNITSSTQYFYYPYAPAGPPNNRNVYSTSLSYVLERSTHQRILQYDRSFGLSYAYNRVGSQTNNLGASFNYSLNDYILPSASLSYKLPTGDPSNSASPGAPAQILSEAFGLQFQSPSQCWKLALSLSRSVDLPDIHFGLDFSLNLTGSGFGGVSDVTSKAGVN